MKKSRTISSGNSTPAGKSRLRGGRMAVIAMLAALMFFSHGLSRAIAQQPMFSISPRFYQTWIEADEFAEPIVMPIGGLTVSVAPFPNWDFSLNALYGVGESDFREIAIDPNVGFDGDGTVEAERLDLEFLIRHRYPDSSAYVVAGVRYILFTEEFTVDSPGLSGAGAGCGATPCFNAGKVEEAETEFILGELGAGFAARISKSGRHSAFANVVLGLGSFETTEELFNGTAACGVSCTGKTTDDGLAFLADANVGYQYAFTRSASLSVRWRVIAVHNGGEESNLSVVHGPEIAGTFRF